MCRCFLISETMCQTLTDLHEFTHSLDEGWDTRRGDGYGGGRGAATCSSSSSCHPQERAQELAEVWHLRLLGLTGAGLGLARGSSSGCGRRRWCWTRGGERKGGGGGRRGLRGRGGSGCGCLSSCGRNRNDFNSLSCFKGQIYIHQLDNLPICPGTKSCPTSPLIIWLRAAGLKGCEQTSLVSFKC